MSFVCDDLEECPNCNLCCEEGEQAVVEKYDPKMCGRCYEIVDELFPANCNEKPETLIGQPIGQYHCPDCGAMVLAGCKHPDLCQVCIDRQHPGFDGEVPYEK